MGMTKQHFEAIAEALRMSYPQPSHSIRVYAIRMAQWDRQRQALADMCHLQGGWTNNGNRKFNREKFLAACEPIKEKQE